MKRINVSFFYNLATTVSPLVQLPDSTTWLNIIAIVMVLKQQLNALLGGQGLTEIQVKRCKPEAIALLGWLATIESINDTRTLNASEISRTRHHAQAFENSLKIELRDLPIYFVPPVLGYDTDLLLSNGVINLSEATQKYLSTLAKRNFNEGCCCLALNQATAAGFLLLRATEDVMHDYYDVLTGGADRPIRRNMGDYIAALEQISAVSQEMLAVLRDIKNLRRNPIMHPEHVLEMDDAVAIFDVSKSAISAMARQAKEHQAQPIL